MSWRVGSDFARPQSVVPACADDPISGRGGFALCDAMRSRNSSSDFAPTSSTFSLLEPAEARCTWASLNPGMTKCPPRSTTCVCGLSVCDDFVVGADGEDAAIADRHRLRRLPAPSEPASPGVDVAVDEDHVRFASEAALLRGPTTRGRCQDKMGNDQKSSFFGDSRQGEQ